MKALKVAINAQITPGGGHGGVENVLRALITALGQLDDGDEEYIIIGPHQEPDWLAPHLSGNMRIVRGPKPAIRFSGRAPSFLRPLLIYLRRALINIIGGDLLNPYPHVPVSDGFYESLGADVIHFPYQAFIICALPSLFNPHDLQHKHYPSFFSPKQLREREVLYTTACQYAQAIAVACTWLKDDIVRHCAITQDKIQVIPLAPLNSPFSLPPDIKSIRKTYNLPDTYMLYPAVTWPHKNHLRLLEAIAALRDKHDLRVDLICTGALNAYYHAEIAPRIEAFDLAEQVRFLGRIPGEDLRALYRQAQCVVQPSLFEASSSMLWEAAQEGIPAIASNIPTIREQAGKGAMLFDPLDVNDIADTIRQVMTDETLRASIVDYSTQHLKVFSWKRTAKAYRALYRKLARVPLSEEDRRLLSWNWMQDDDSEL